jgi:four helix bundle protein
MSFRFEKLNVWIGSREFVTEIYKVTSQFSSNERFALTDQIKRASVSIVLNIAEGSGRNSDKEYVRSLRMAIGSLNETVTCLYIALDLNYIKRSDFELLYVKANSIGSKINALINSIKKTGF